VHSFRARRLLLQAAKWFNVGAEFLAGRWFSGWLGTYTNLAAKRSDTNYTGGVGFGIGRLQLSLALAASSSSFTIRGGDVHDRLAGEEAARELTGADARSAETLRARIAVGREDRSAP
jgi:hypothetical protein